MVGGHSCVRLHLLLVVTRLIVIVECHWSRGHPDTDLVYIIITGHMGISDSPFNKPLLGKNIRFTHTNSSNPILMAHSCGLGGKYWYKHTKVFQTEHLKRLVQGCLVTWLFSYRLTVSNLLMTEWDKCYFHVRRMVLIYFHLNLALILLWPVENQYAILPLVSWLVLLFRPTIGHTCNFKKANNAPLRAWYSMHCCMNKYWDVCVCVGFKGLYFPVLSFSAYSSGVL